MSLVDAAVVDVAAWCVVFGVLLSARAAYRWRVNRRLKRQFAAAERAGWLSLERSE